MAKKKPKANQLHAAIASGLCEAITEQLGYEAEHQAVHTASGASIVIIVETGSQLVDGYNIYLDDEGISLNDSNNNPVPLDYADPDVIDQVVNWVRAEIPRRVAAQRERELNMTKAANRAANQISDLFGGRRRKK